MALIDVDRHILSELITLQRRIRKHYLQYRTQWEKIQEVKDHTDVLLFVHPDGCEGTTLGGEVQKRTPQCKNTKELLWQERNKIMKDNF